MAVQHQQIDASNYDNQREAILDHLKRIGTITQLEALRYYGVGRLSARIKQLRERGHEIATHQDDPTDYAEYELIETND